MARRSTATGTGDAVASTAAKPKSKVALNRRPSGYWRTFSNWWRKRHEALRSRPTVCEVIEWYNKNASTAWSKGQEPSLKAVLRQSKGLRPINGLKEYFREYRRKRKEQGGMALTAAGADGPGRGNRSAKRRRPRSGRFDSSCSSEDDEDSSACCSSESDFGASGSDCSDSEARRRPPPRRRPVRRPRLAEYEVGAASEGNGEDELHRPNMVRAPAHGTHVAVEADPAAAEGARQAAMGPAQAAFDAWQPPQDEPCDGTPATAAAALRAAAAPIEPELKDEPYCSQVVFVRAVPASRPPPCRRGGPAAPAPALPPLACCLAPVESALPALEVEALPDEVAAFLDMCEGPMLEPDTHMAAAAAPTNSSSGMAPDAAAAAPSGDCASGGVSPAAAACARAPPSPPYGASPFTHPTQQQLPQPRLSPLPPLDMHITPTAPPAQPAGHPSPPSRYPPSYYDAPAPLPLGYRSGTGSGGGAPLAADGSSSGYHPSAPWPQDAAPPPHDYHGHGHAAPYPHPHPHHHLHQAPRGSWSAPHWDAHDAPAPYSLHPSARMYAPPPPPDAGPCRGPCCVPPHVYGASRCGSGPLEAPPPPAVCDVPGCRCRASLLHPQPPASARPYSRMHVYGHPPYGAVPYGEEPLWEAPRGPGEGDADGEVCSSSVSARRRAMAQTQAHAYGHYPHPYAPPPPLQQQQQQQLTHGSVCRPGPSRLGMPRMPTLPSLPTLAGLDSERELDPNSIGHPSPYPHQHYTSAPPPPPAGHYAPPYHRHHPATQSQRPPAQHPYPYPYEGDARYAAPSPYAPAPYHPTYPAGAWAGPAPHAPYGRGMVASGSMSSFADAMPPAAVAPAFAPAGAQPEEQGAWPFAGAARMRQHSRDVPPPDALPASYGLADTGAEVPDGRVQPAGAELKLVGADGPTHGSFLAGDGAAAAAEGDLSPAGSVGLARHPSLELGADWADFVTCDGMF